LTDDYLHVTFVYGHDSLSCELDIAYSHTASAVCLSYSLDLIFQIQYYKVVYVSRTE